MPQKMKMMKKLQELDIEEIMDDKHSPVNKVLTALRKPVSVLMMVGVATVLFIGIRFGHQLQY